MSLLRLLLCACEAGFAVSAGALVYAALQQAPDGHLGARGRSRARAHRRHPVLRALDPMLRMSSRLVARALPATAQTRLTRLLLHSGNPLGLTAEELWTICLVCAALAAATGVGAAHAMNRAPLPMLIGAFLLGAALPVLHVRAAVMRRRRQVDRELPSAIDLLGLCMSAGVDFTRALHLWLERSAVKGSALAEEFERLAHALALGHTRAAALQALADNVPTVGVVDWANAVIHAERKGTPLAVVIETQAHMLRLRRSVAAEQAAARAALWLLLPLLLLLVAIMLILFAPFFIRGLGV